MIIRILLNFKERKKIPYYFYVLPEVLPLELKKAPFKTVCEAGCLRKKGIVRVQSFLFAECFIAKTYCQHSI